MRRERASCMHSTAPNTQTCLPSVYCACNTMDGDVSATCTAKRARPASQASGLAPDRPCRLQAALLCSPTRTEMGAPAGERRLAASEEPKKKRIEAPYITLERVTTSEQQLALEPQSICKQRKQAKHVPAAASDSHIARNFFFLRRRPSI